jgi:hypothetical protein
LALWAGPGALALLAAANACNAKVSSTPDGLGATGGTPAASGSGGSSGSSGSGSSATGGDTSGGAVGGSGAQGGGTVIPVTNMGGTGTGATGDLGGAAGDDSGLCATVATSAELDPVYLAFAFDVSASMGNLGFPWYDPTLKWDPAVAATRGFLEDAGSSGMFASLTAFPSAAGGEEICGVDQYAKPDVGMAALPSTDFGQALEDIRAQAWRGGTPTLPALEGVSKFVNDYRKTHPGHYAIVLVTDGYPQGCEDASNSIESVEDFVSAQADDLPTYVIGVKNPPIEDSDGNSAPDTVSDMAGVAKAGGTQKAFLIDTGDPQQTRTDFLKAVDEIRGSAISCSLEVPMAPDGRTFLKDHVVVSVTEGDETKDLTYDEECQADGAWHYDSTDKPTEVILCPDTCTGLRDSQLEAASDAKIQVGFTCQPVIVIR